MSDQSYDSNTQPAPHGDDTWRDDLYVRGANLSLTDLGNAHRLAHYQGKNVRRVNDLGVWRAWDGKRWAKANDDMMGAIAIRIVMNMTKEIGLGEQTRERQERWRNTSCGSHSLTALIRVAGTLEDMWTPSDEWDRGTEWFNCANCTVRPIAINDWHEHRRSDYITLLCPTDWVPDATSPLLDGFLDRFLPNRQEREHILQTLAVAALTPGNHDRKVILLLGPPTTGKSTLADLANVTLGKDYIATVNASAFRGNLDDKPRPDLMRALTTNLLLAFEASENWELHADQIKRMTGGDPITARAMRSDDMVEKIAPFTPVIVANTTPRVKGADAALRQRLRVLLMDHQIEDDGGRKRDELVNDVQARRAFLALLIRSYREANGHIPKDIPQRFAEATMDAFNALDDSGVAEILDDMFEDKWLSRVDGLPISHYATTTQLRKFYVHQLGRNGKPLGRKQFTLRLRDLGYDVPTAEHRSGGATRVLGVVIMVENVPTEVRWALDL